MLAAYTIASWRKLKHDDMERLNGLDFQIPDEENENDEKGSRIRARGSLFFSLDSREAGGDDSWFEPKRSPGGD